MASYQIVYWRDIPAQVKVKAGRVRAARPLSERFQVYIDRAAMRAGLFNTDDYLAEWRTGEAVEREGEPEAVAEAVIAELEAAYPDERLEQLVLNGGKETTHSP
ncbi:MAG: virulence factor [Anaerolineales bacterium]|nr:virulence factor [Anaerolineales bacterium]MDW8327592.1 virulence factor [Anaerolineales bacterium]